jgi:DNA polymerase III gamma/tau subunit
VEALLSGGQGLEVFCNDLIDVLRTLLLVRTCGPAAALVDIPAGATDEYVALAQRFELSHYVQMIPMLEELRRNVRYSGAGRALTEAVIVRFARMQEWASIEQLLRQLPAGGPAPREPGPRAPDENEKKKFPPVSPPAEKSVPAAQPRPWQNVHSARSEAGASATDLPATQAVAPTALPATARAAAGAAAGDDAGPATMPPESAVAAATRAPVTTEERRRIEQDPVVRAALRLFDGVIVRVERTASSAE